MKFDKPFVVRLSPNYKIKEPVNYVDVISTSERVNQLGGQVINSKSLDEVNGDEEVLSSGGRFEWGLFHDPNSQKPEISINLMRIWCLQMVTQMVNNKSFVNEIHSTIDVDIEEEDREKFLDIISKIITQINDEIELVSSSLVLKKKNKFNF
jgi:hypothetical protein